MKKKLGIIKRYIAVLLIVAMSINSFGAVISDNDGSAFITKSEFDALKSSFQAQIDTYNQSIDSKIDGSIASYLSGISIAKQTTLSLPAECGYQFPLIYDTDNKWNDINSSWFINVRPELHQTRYQTRWFTGDYTSNNRNWTKSVFEASLSQLGKFDVPGAEPAQGKYWTALVSTEYQFATAGGFADACEVSKSTDTRTVNGHTGAFIYDRKTFGLGKPVVNYAPDFSLQEYTTNSGAIERNPAYIENFVYYPYCFGFQYDWRGNASSMTHTSPYGDDTKWQPFYLKYGAGGNVRRYTETSAAIPFTGLWGIRPLVKQFKVPRGSTGGSMIFFIDENTKIDNSTISWQQTSVTNRIYGRGSNCPILSDTFSLQFVNSPTVDTAWWEYVYGYTKPLGYGAFSTATISQLALLVAGNFGFMPKNKVADNTKFDASDSEYFSQLPSSLVRYNTASGVTHYIDEGMWLGEFDKNGTVSFSLSFGKDSGSGTKVKLHVSKKPFSFEYNPSDLIDITVNGTKSKEPELNYNTFYTVKLEDIEKNDNLYLEWVPSDSADLSKLLTFQDFFLESKD